MTPHGIFDNAQTQRREQWQCGVLIGVATWITFASMPWGYFNDLPRA
jgi:hypothetical protein